MAERVTQNRIRKLIEEKLGYTYLGNLEGYDNRNVDEAKLKAYLKKAGYEARLITRAIHELTTAASIVSDSLYDSNMAVYTLLRYGQRIKPAVDEEAVRVYYINWKEPLKNDFYIAEEVTVNGPTYQRRPDIVLYINGIAIAVLELKASAVSMSKGIRQNISSQTDIRAFFNTVQFCLAGNDTEGLRYGTIESSEKHYLKWKEDADTTDPVSTAVHDLRDESRYSIDNDIISLFYKERLIEFVYNFVIFDGGTKKLARPNQFYGVQAARTRIAKGECGIIWHTQGSGKSLTMVWLSRVIKESNPSARILIITDREELDDQIENKVFGKDAAGDSIYRTKSGADLIEKINAYAPVTMCSLIHKFGKRVESESDERRADRDYKKYIAELKASLPSDFLPKGDFYVFVDECHRTQSGMLHAAMKAILPDAIFIGFTGTPLLSQQKKSTKSSIQIFGGYIHTYKYNEATADGVVLDLRYEARDIPQWLSSPSRIDEWFEMKTRGLTDLAKAQLKQRWGTLKGIFSSEARLGKIVSDIIFDMERYPRLQSGQGNALLVSGTIYEACKYYELFQRTPLAGKCAIITSYTASRAEIKLEDTGESETESIFKNETYQKMLDGKTPEQFEKEVKKLFIEQPARMKLLIVVDKLLTGFDAPPATYLYIDKSMQNHGLFQAICRVNRLDGDEKEYGYIIDYKDLFKELEQAVADYTTEALGEFDREDVEGLLRNGRDEAKKHFEDTLESLRVLCEPVATPKDTLQFMHYFCSPVADDVEIIKENEPKRLALYRLTAALLRAYADIAGEMSELGYTDQQAEKLKQEVVFYKTKRDEIKLASGDYIDLKKYEPDMRHLLDTYIAAGESEKLSAFDDLSLIEIIVAKEEAFVNDLPEGIRGNKDAVAETVESNVRKKIVEKQLANPKYYEQMSALLDELIRQRRENALAYAEYLKQIVELTKRVNQPDASRQYPQVVKSSAAMRALYDNITQDTDFIERLHKTILRLKPADWYGNPQKEMVIRRNIRQLVNTDNVEEMIFEIVKAQGEYR